MSTLELTCPACGRRLEVDEGFAGGVCRCSYCGSLMSVPHRQDAPAEEVTRSARPDQPGRASGPASTPPPADATDELAEAVETPRREPASDAGSPPSSAMDEITYTTASGQTVRLGAGSRIPTARKKKRIGVRIATASVFVLLLAGLTLSVIVAASSILRQRRPPQRTLNTTPIFAWNRGANPYTMSKPNVLGLPPVESETLVIVDASAASEPWLELVKPALTRGLTREGTKATFELYYATPAATKALNRNQLVDATNLRPPKLRQFQAPINAAGEVGLEAALERARTLRPDQIVLITARALNEPRVDAMRSALKPMGEVLFDVILIGATSEPLDRLTLEPPPGRYITGITAAQLQRWREQAQSTTQATIR